MHFSPQAGHALFTAEEGRLSQLPEPQVNIIRPHISTLAESVRATNGGSALSRIGVIINRPWHGNRKASKEVHPSDLFSSANFRHWYYMALAILFFVIVRIRHFHHPRDKEERHWTNVKLLGIWACMAGVYASVIGIDKGKYSSMDWLSGYTTELIFSFENIFIFLSIVEAFKTPQRLTTGLLTIVTFCQVFYQGVLFMGLAHWLKHLAWLPYAMGVWLLGVAAYSLIQLLGSKSSSLPASRLLTPRNPDDDMYEVSLLGSPVLSILRRLFGERVIVSYAEDSAFVERSGKWHVTLLVPVFVCLLCADFAMEIDVSFTKIEEMDNPYIGFSSSALAAFAMPELFWLARILFERFWLLHYGVAAVLMFFGFQLLLERVVSILPLVECGIQTGIMLICIIASQVMDLNYKSIYSDSDEDTRHPKGRSSHSERVPEARKMKHAPAEDMLSENERMPSCA